MKINCIIIEDEPLALERTKSYVLRLPHLNLVATFENGLDAIIFLGNNTIDLIFLDINMDELSGIQLLENIKVESEIIITTAHSEYALKGFDLNVTDYLLKPFTFDRFLQALAKVGNNLSKKISVSEKEFIFVKTEYRLEKISLNEVIYIEGMRDYRCIYTNEKRIMTLQTFKDFEQEIPSSIVCRVHKSYMVALNKIVSVERNRIKLKNSIIPISETYKKQFLAHINHQ